MGAPEHWMSRAGLLRTSKSSGQPQQPPSPGVQTCVPSQPHAKLPPCLLCAPLGARGAPGQQASTLGGGTNNVWAPAKQRWWGVMLGADPNTQSSLMWSLALPQHQAGAPWSMGSPRQGLPGGRGSPGKGSPGACAPLGRGTPGHGHPWGQGHPRDTGTLGHGLSATGALQRQGHPTTWAPQGKGAPWGQGHPREEAS